MTLECGRKREESIEENRDQVFRTKFTKYRAGDCV